MLAEQPLRVRREHQISDISRFWVNNVTLKKVLRIANIKFHDLFQLCSGIHGKTIVLPRNQRVIAKFMTRSSSPPVLLAGHADFRVVTIGELPSIFSVGTKSPMRSMSAKSFIAKWDGLGWVVGQWEVVGMGQGSASLRALRRLRSHKRSL